MKKDIKKNVKKDKKRNKKKNIGIYALIITLVIITTTVLVIKYNIPIIEIEEAQPVKETPVEEPIKEPEETITEEELEEPEPEQPSEENTIEIRKDAFYPKDKIIGKNTEIKWLKKDTRDFNLNCYLEGTRIIQSPNLKEGDSFTHTFYEEGEYICLTTPYGLRSTIKVESAPLLSPTGRVVLKDGQGIDGFSLAAMIIITMALILGFSYRGKGTKIRNLK